MSNQQASIEGKVRHSEAVISVLYDLVTSAPSVAVFRSWLKTPLFNISYPCVCTVPAQ